MSKDKSKQKQQLPEQKNDEVAFKEIEKKYQHDEYCKSKLKNKEIAKKFLKFVFKQAKDLLDIEKLKIEPESYLDKRLKQYYLDILYRIPIKNSKKHIVVFVLVELKTSNDRWTIFQMLVYIVRILEREYNDAKSKKQLRNFSLPMVIPLIFSHGKDPFNSPTELSKLFNVPKGCEKYVLNLEAMLFDVQTLKSEDFPDSREDKDLFVLFKSLQSIFNEDVVKSIMEIYQVLQPTIDSKESQEKLHDVVHYAATSAKHFSPQDFDNLINQINNKGDKNMSSSTLRAVLPKYLAQLRAEVQEEERIKIRAKEKLKIRAEVRAEEKLKIRAKVKEEEKLKIRAEVKEEEKLKIRAEVKREDILTVLCRRFKMTNVPKRIKSAIMRMNDLIALESLHGLALDCQTLDEFAEALN
jgi:hypothetical protein